MEVVVEFTFVNELWVVRVGGLDFNSDLKVGLGVDGLVDLPKGALIDFPDDFEVLADFFQHLRHCGSVVNN